MCLVYLVSLGDVKVVSTVAIPEKLCKGSEFLTPDTFMMAGTNDAAMATVIKHLPLDVSSGLNV